MPSKPGISFTRCPNCAALLLGADNEKHSTICSPLSPLTELEETNHGMIFDRVFYGKSVESKESPQGLSGWLKENFLLLHPKTAENLGSQIEAPCLLTTGDDSWSLCVAWPSEKVGKLEIGRRGAVKTETWNSVKPIDHWKKCQFLVLHPVSADVPHTSLSNKVVKSYLDRAFILAGSTIRVPLYGAVMEFQVERIEGTEECESLCPSFAALNISSSSLEQSDSSRTSSPRTPNKKGAAETAPVAKPPDSFPDVFQITSESEISIRVSTSNSTRQMRGLEDFGGAKETKDALQKFLIEPLKSEKSTPVRRFLIHGGTGLGKSYLLRCIAAELSPTPAPLIKLGASFRESGNHNVCLLMDNLQGICVESKAKRSEMVLNLEEQLDEMSEHQWLVAACGDIESIPMELRRRFDLELELTVPSSSERLSILSRISERFSLSLPVADLESVATAAHGYTGSDLCTVIRQWVANQKLDGENSLISSLRNVVPSAMREVVRELPKVIWDEVGGEEEVKAEVRQSVEWPLLHPQAFRRLGVEPPKGILLYGPPGCSKTMIARAVATESGLNFLAVKGPELFSKWVGESEKAMRTLFARARRAAPSVVFFDEIDAVGVARGDGGGAVGDRVLAQLLTEIDGLEKSEGVTIIAATNRPHVLDTALLRPGRLDKVIYVPLPDPDTRDAIFKLRLSKMPVATDVDRSWLVQSTSGYSGAEIDGVCKEAALAAMREALDVKEIGKHHFKAAFERIRPRNTPDSLKAFDEFNKLMG